MSYDMLSDSLNVPTTKGIDLDTPASMVTGDGNVRRVKIAKIAKKSITVEVRPGRELTYAWHYRDCQWVSDSNVFAPTYLALGPCATRS